MLTKILAILTKEERNILFMLSSGSIILSISETFSIGIIIPILSLFIDQEKIRTSHILSTLYRFLGVRDVNLFLTILIIIAILVFVFRSAFSIFMAYAQQRNIGKIYIRLTSDVLETYLDKPYSFHLSSNSSELFKNLSFEVGQFITGFLTPIILIGSEVIVLLGIFLFLIYVFPVATFLLVGIFGIIMWSTFYIFKKRIKLYSAQREKYSGQYYKNALEALHAVKEIKVFNAQAFFIERFSEAIKRYQNAFIKFSVVSIFPRYLFETAIVSAMLLSVLFSILLHKTFAELILMLTVFGLAAIRLVPSFSKIYSNVNLFHYSKNSLDMVYGVLKERSNQKLKISILQDVLPGLKEYSVDLQNITFCYEGASKPIFDHLSITIPFKQTVAIAGLTGSGKSTLIDIAMGLLMPSQGNLSYRGSVINQDNVLEYRKRIGYVPQNLCLIDDTISANIAFGIPIDKIDSERLKRGIKIAQLEPFIKDLPQGLNTQIGEKGIRISGGQKQRVGIARAVYRNPEILILDEATSALDRYTEVKLYAALRDFNKELTILLVTHRMDTLQHADYIYVMDSGKIVDQGSFKALLENSDIFRKIIHQAAPSVDEIFEDI